MFHSVHANQRTDQYGGDIAGRRRFLVENAGCRSPGLSGKPANDRPPTDAYWLSRYRGPGKGAAH